MISERDLGYESDNLINYYAGPVKISICGFDNTICLKTNSNWEYLLLECLETAKEAWKINDLNKITIKKNEILIKYNFENLKLYIEYSIIFL